MAQHIHQGKDVVPKAIYHFGKKTSMEENIKARSIPKAAWDKFIMGDKTTYPLQPNRRGLYGTAGIDTNHYGSKNDSWMIEVHIKEECRKPQNVVSIENLPKSPRFLQWFETQSNAKKLFATPQDFAKKCFHGNGEPHGGFHGKFSDPNCERLIDFYLENSNVKVIQDHLISKSFYIRDRNCIENILGTPEEIVAIALKREFLWMTLCASKGAKDFAIIVEQALRESREVYPQATIDSLIQNYKLAGIDASTLHAYLRCQKKNKLSEFKSEYGFDALQEICK